MLTNVRNLTASQAHGLGEFVRAGGGLAIFLGDQCDPRFYNQVLGAEGLLPAELQLPVGVEGSGVAGQPMHLLEADADHPTLARFTGTLGGALSGVEVYRAWELTPHDAWVYAGMEGGRPLLVERNLGRGKVIMCASMPTPAWTSLPLRRVFVTWVGQTIGYLAGVQRRSTDGRVGRDLPLPFAGDPAGQPVIVRRPDGRSLDSAVAYRGGKAEVYLPGEAVGVPGFYSVPSHDSNDSRDQVVAVNVPVSESVPGVLDFDAAARGSGHWLLHRADPAAADAHTLLDARQLSLGLWDYLLWVVMILVLIEPLVANFVAAGARGGSGRMATGLVLKDA
jgi:hypothetical protein